ncbi:hypothetical protein I4U23_006232 [Adineta vaga]|nr:hypothetical protein I4U23_006232 [Adineta vaga]
MISDDDTVSTLQDDGYYTVLDPVLNDTATRYSSERHCDNDCEAKADDDIDSSDVHHDIEEHPEVQSNFSKNRLESERLSDSTELFVLLFFTWKRHSISKAAANDICRIINMLNIPNMPKNFCRVMKHLKRNSPTLLDGNQSFVCPLWGNKCTSASKCNLMRCQPITVAAPVPTSVFVLPLVPPICSILERETLVKHTYESSQCDDMLNSRRCEDIMFKEKQINLNRNCIKLTLNTGI